MFCEPYYPYLCPLLTWICLVSPLSLISPSYFIVWVHSERVWYQSLTFKSSTRQNHIQENSEQWGFLSSPLAASPDTSWHIHQIKVSTGVTVVAKAQGISHTTKCAHTVVMWRYAARTVYRKYTWEELKQGRKVKFGCLVQLTCVWNKVEALAKEKAATMTVFQLHIDCSCTTDI